MKPRSGNFWHLLIVQLLQKLVLEKWLLFPFLGFHSVRTLNYISYSQTGAHVRTPGELLEMLISGPPLESLIEKLRAQALPFPTSSQAMLSSHTWRPIGVDGLSDFFQLLYPRRSATRLASLVLHQLVIKNTTTSQLLWPSLVVIQENCQHEWRKCWWKSLLHVLIYSFVQQIFIEHSMC